ncbi:unnamed protein product, partial [Prorocentrum cordatum]
MQHDIARDINQLVEKMILDAKHNSETKVGKEIQKLKSKMDQMNEKIRVISEKLNRQEASNGGGFLKSDLQQSISKLEEVWNSECEALKHELWQTIQAHNHNADLLKHHKDAIDQIQISWTDGPSYLELEQVHAQLAQAQNVVERERSREQQIDQLVQRIAIAQQQLTAGAGGWAAAMGGMPGFP